MNEKLDINEPRNRELTDDDEFLPSNIPDKDEPIQSEIADKDELEVWWQMVNYIKR